MVDSHDAYKLTEGFTELNQWRKFVRNKLNLNDEKIKEIETNCNGNLEENRFQTYVLWRKQRDSNDRESFKKLKHEFFCVDYLKGYEINVAPAAAESTPIESTDDDPEREISTHEEKPAPANKAEVTPQQDNAKISGAVAKGCALIITNPFHHSRSLRNRYSTSKSDGKKMKELWKDILKCDLFGDKVHEAQSASDMMKLFKDLSKVKKEYAYIVVVISTHGGAVTPKLLENYGHGKKSIDDNFFQTLNEAYKQNELLSEVFFGNDEKLLSYDQMMNVFLNKNAVGVRNVPKFFILEYCRGRMTDGGVFPGEVAFTETIGIDDETQLIVYENVLPEMSDVLVAFATQRYYAALCGMQGSWLIEEIFEVFKKYWQEKHTLDMLTKVNAAMKTRYGYLHGTVVKAMSVFESSLTDDLFLGPKEESEEGS